MTEIKEVENKIKIVYIFGFLNNILKIFGCVLGLKEINFIVKPKPEVQSPKSQSQDQKDLGWH